MHWSYHSNLAACGQNEVSFEREFKSVVLNASLDMLKLRLPQLRILRVYSEKMERQVFPIPRDSAQTTGGRRGRQYELIDKDEHHDIALHHLIRKSTNPFHGQILNFDRRFMANRTTPEKVTDKEVGYWPRL